MKKSNYPHEMKVSLDKYFALIKKHPSLVKEYSDPQSIKVILNEKEILEWQETRIKENQNKGEPIVWAQIGLLVDDPWYYVIRDLVEFPGGLRNGYIRYINRKSLEGGTNVIVAPKYKNKYLLIRHFRHETRKWHWEFPKGGGEPSLTAKENAIKELWEEVGVTSKSLKKLLHIKGSDGNTAFYLAAIANLNIVLGVNEGIESYKLLKLRDIKKWVRSGKIDDPHTIMAILYLR